ncbi:isoaspartyl peptidase/L-asparaginase, partial [Zunongwangia profunda]
MKNLLLLLSIFVFIACGNTSEKETTPAFTSEAKPQDDIPNFGIVIHGGAGTILKENMSDSLEKAYKTKLEEAIRTGHEILANGGTAIQAVQRTINVMEDSPLFNSAKGAVFANDETNQLDASIMDGKTLNAGAVAGV